MKTLLLVTAAAAAFAAAPALAQTAAPVGSAGITWSNSEADIGGASFEDGAGQVDANVAGDFGAWTATFAGSVSWADGEIDEDRVAAAQVHVTRKFDDIRVGGFVGLTSVAGEQVTTAGLEAAKYTGPLTVSGALAVSHMGEVDVVALNGDIAYFVQDNLRLNVGVGAGNLDTDFDNTRYLSMGAGAEYRIPATSLSVVGGYERTSIEDFDLDIDTFSLGLRFSFGVDTLRARDAAGADLGRTVGGLTALSAF